MSRFHFNLYGSTTELDEGGQELPGWEEARTEAMRLVGTILENRFKLIALGEDWCVEVTDDTELVLFRLDLSVMVPPMTGLRPSQPNEI